MTNIKAITASPMIAPMQPTITLVCWLTSKVLLAGCVEVLDKGICVEKTVGKNIFIYLRLF